jgi:uncharacterized repeat protein (TIGR03843 family)
MESSGYPVNATDVLDRLRAAEVKPHGFIANASNHTLLVQVGDPADGVAAVYKPRAGERPLWDFPSGTLCDREVAAYVVSAFLGWDVVPPTALRDHAPMGPGSMQLFVPHDPQAHYFALVDDPTTHEPLARMALFDLLVNNADRKASHVLRADDGSLWGCDHGLTFHSDPKLRTVIWELGGHRLDGSLRADLGRLATALTDTDSAVTHELEELLGPDELRALGERASLLRGLRALPDVDADRRPYPWPPL